MLCARPRTCSQTMQHHQIQAAGYRLDSSKMYSECFAKRMSLDQAGTVSLVINMLPHNEITTVKGLYPKQMETIQSSQEYRRILILSLRARSQGRTVVVAWRSMTTRSDCRTLPLQTMIFGRISSQMLDSISMMVCFYLLIMINWGVWVRRHRDGMSTCIVARTRVNASSVEMTRYDGREYRGRHRVYACFFTVVTVYQNATIHCPYIRPDMFPCPLI